MLLITSAAALALAASAQDVADPLPQPDPPISTRPISPPPMPMAVPRPQLRADILPLEHWAMDQYACSNLMTINGNDGAVTLNQTIRGVSQIYVAESAFAPPRRINKVTGEEIAPIKISLAIGSAGEPQVHGSWAVHRLSGDRGWARSWPLTEEMVKVLRDEPVIRMQVDGGPETSIDLPEFSAAWRNVRACVYNKKQDRLALRPEGEAANFGPRPPRPERNPGRWLQYPSRALREAAEGRVVVAVSVDRYGFPQKCEVIEPSGQPTLDSRTCPQFMRRGQFYPARDRFGYAVAGTYHSGVTWQIPD